MHQYKIEVYELAEDGSVNELLTTRYADNYEQAHLICGEYENKKQDNGAKAYNVVLYILCYKVCQDRDAFFAQFQA